MAAEYSTKELLLVAQGEMARLNRELSEAKHDAAAWKKLAESALELARVGASVVEIDKLLNGNVGGAGEVEAPPYRSIGWRAVTRSRKDGYAWLSSRIVRESKDADSIVAQWQVQYPRGSDDPLEYTTEQVFTPSVQASAPNPQPPASTESPARGGG